MHKAPGHRSRACIQVLVRAPAREIHVPVVEPRRQVARPVREVPPRQRAHRMRRRGDALDAERLPRGIVHAADHHEGQRVGRLADGIQYVFLADQRLAAARADLDDVLRRVKPARVHVRMHRIGIARERAALHQDLRALPLRPPEAHHQQVQVDGERVHHHHLTGLRPHQARAQMAKMLVEINPRATGKQMPFHRQPRPIVQLLVYQRARRARHEAERIAAEIRERTTVLAERMLELVPQRAQRIGGIEPRRVLRGGVQVRMRARARGGRLRDV